MVSVYLPSDALSQHLPSYLGFSYLGRGVSLQGCSSKARQLLLTLDEGYLLRAAPPDLERGAAPLALLRPRSRRSLEVGSSCPAGHLTSRVGRFLWPPPLTSGLGKPLWPPLLRCRSLALWVATPGLGRRPAPHRPACARSHHMLKVGIICQSETKTHSA